MSKPAPIRSRTLNLFSYNASLRESGSLTVWFDPGIAWRAAPSGRRGRQQTFSNAAIQPCLTIEVLFGLPMRQTTGFVASLLKLAGLDRPVPDFRALVLPSEDAGGTASLPGLGRLAAPSDRQHRH